MATKAMINGTLNLVIVDAENLKKKDLLNKMDPYCVVEFNDETFKTQPHKKGHQNPTWEESLKIPVRGKSLNEKIVFSVYDKELIHDNKIGRAEFTLQQLADLGQKEDLCTVELETFGVVDKHKPAGTLKFRINFTGDGWPGSVTESDKPQAVAMPKKDDKAFQEHKNLEHFSDVDGKEKRLDKDDRIPQSIEPEPVHTEKKDINRYDDGLNKDKHLTGDNDYDDLNKDKSYDYNKTKLTDDSQDNMPATSLVNPNEMIPHDRREKSPFQKDKVGLENDSSTFTPQTDITKDFRSSDTNTSTFTPQTDINKDFQSSGTNTSTFTPQTDINKDFQSSDTNKAFGQHQNLNTNNNNSNKLNTEYSLDKERQDLHNQSPDLAYHNKDV